MSAPEPETAGATAPASADVRARLGKIVGMLGSEGESANALVMLRRALANANLTYGWLSDVVAHSDMRGGEREKLFARLVRERLADGLAYAWCLQAEEAAFVRIVAGRADLAGTDVQSIARAIAIADEAKRRAGAPGGGAKRRG